MPYYHIQILYKDPKIEYPSYLYEIDLTEEDMKLFSEQYEKGLVFFNRKWMDYSNIKEVEIRKTSLKSTDYYPKRDSSSIFYGSGADIEIVTRQFIKSPPRKERSYELASNLMKTAAFLGLDSNWSSATCALQLQEVSMTLMANKKNIELNKANVGRILSKEIKTISFNDQYEAFSRQVKTSFNIEMPILTTHLRKMRTKVLHEGYNPKPEETASIVGFTIGLLKKLRSIS